LKRLWMTLTTGMMIPTTLPTTGLIILLTIPTTMIPTTRHTTADHQTTPCTR
jgi:hypothetical protein